MRTAIRSDEPSASASGIRIVDDDRDARDRLRPVDERVEHERDERDRRGHDRAPRDPLQPGPLVRAAGTAAPSEVTHQPDDAQPPSTTITIGVSDTAGLRSTSTAASTADAT